LGVGDSTLIYDVLYGKLDDEKENDKLQNRNVLAFAASDDCNAALSVDTSTTDDDIVKNAFQKINEEFGDNLSPDNYFPTSLRVGPTDPTSKYRMPFLLAKKIASQMRIALGESEYDGNLIYA